MTGRDDDRIRKIISWIIDNDTEEPYNPGNVYARLENMGYSPEEIRQAMLLLDADSVRCGMFADNGFDRATRILSVMEKGMLSLDAQGWLLWLRSTGWISETHLCLIIESAGFEYRAPASLEEVMEIALRYVPSIPGESEEDGNRNIN